MHLPKDYPHSLNQLYHPTSKYGQDNQNLVYVSDILNNTKFTPILLKEWFYLLKKNGYLIIDYYPNHLCDWQKLEELMWWLWKGKYDIKFHSPITQKEVKGNSNSNLLKFIKSLDNLDQSITCKNIDSSKPIIRFICQKTVSTLIPNDNINSWTFGIITNGKRPELIKDIIRSIRCQNIPNYQIIICGNYLYNKKDKDILHIPFNNRDDLGWITKKKNIIVKQSKYQNLCLLHDRITLGKNWYHGIKKWGNCFEIILGKTSFQNNEQNLDFVCIDGLNSINIKEMNFFKYLPTGNLQIEDWSQDLIAYSANFIVKKNILTKNPFNESLYWKKFEDLEISQENNKKGYLVRINPKAIFHIKEKTKAFTFTYFSFNDQKIGRLNNENLVLKTMLKLLYFFKISRDNKIIKIFCDRFSKYTKR